MRKLILSMQVSLDGFIEGSGGDMSWMTTDDTDQWQDLFQMLRSVDLFLLGRVMWPDYRNYWKQALISSTASADDVTYAKIAEKTSHVIFSQTLTDPGWENAIIARGAVVEEVINQKNSPGKDILVLGGAKLAATIMEAGLVDEYRLTINPAIIGAGKSFFREQHSRQSLQLADIKKLSSGVIIARYEVSGMRYEV